MLEIGPFTNPKLKRAGVAYFDIMDREGLVARVQTLGLDPNKRYSASRAAENSSSDALSFCSSDFCCLIHADA